MSLDPDQLAVFPLMVLPGTELWHKAAALKLSFDPEPPYFARSHLSMTEEDFAYGRRAIAACRVLESSRTIRFLAREPGLTFSAIVDAWLDWAPGEAPDLTLIPEFVNHLCAEHGLPRGFYERVAARERA
jgi:hypothetical protein